MTNYAHGHEAEKIAAAYLKKRGYKVLELNWRHKRAEIDIVAQRRHEPLTFFEVKYRQTDIQGKGLEYITSSKLRQMAFAAELYVAINKHSGEYCLGAIELSGENFTVTAFLQSV